MKQLHPKAIWLFFFSNIIFWLIAFAVLGIMWAVPFMNLLREGAKEGEVLFLIFQNKSLVSFLILFIILVMFSYIRAKLTYRFYRYELAEDSYRAEKGIIFKRYISIPYERIQNVDIYRGVFDRILGLSDVQIQTAGYGAAGARGIGSEGRLPGLSMEIAEELREELIKRAKSIRT